MAQQTISPPLIRGRWLPMSYETFLDWGPEGMRTEWTDGEGIIYVSTSDRHQWTISLLDTLLGEFVGQFNLGRIVTAPYSVRLSIDGPHREPDLVFVAAQHLDRWTDQRFYGAPDLVVEVLSEDTASEDRTRKREQYEAAGVREYLMIEARPARRGMTYLRLDEDGRYQPVLPDADGRYHSAVLPGFWFDPAWFEQDPLPKPMTLLRRVSPEAWRRLVAEVEANG